ncbi:MAG: PSD1 and planctomycete cytochrome C domain-containing protein [Pirellulales bacterium]
MTDWAAARVAAIVCLCVAAPTYGEVRQTIDFARDIRPILSNHCFRCHGPDAGKRQAGLRFDLRENALAELDSGKRAIVPGAPDEGELIRRVYSDDESEQMPPPELKKPLNDEQRSLLKQWIADGAQYSDHWSFRPLTRPELPHVEDTADWSNNEIDLFVLERLRSAGLQPMPAADRRTLLRRVTLDLTGLPPTPEEVTAFLSDRRSDAYERVVDRLLASPRFGERMAMLWLDLARYADTDGYEKDSHRQMWPYRDWVIEAFNENMPFDQFTIEQLAGDLLPNATSNQLVASAFNRNGPTTSESGVDPAEFAAKYAIDRVNTTGTIWLGITVGCAECHDHKYDPITAKDYYRLFAFFNQVPEEPLYEGADSPPSIPVPSAAQESRLTELALQKATLTSELEAIGTQSGGEEAAAAELRNRLDSLASQEKELLATVPKVRVMRDVPQRRPTNILMRGDYRNPGEEVAPGVPESLGKLPDNEPATRLTLARWLISGQNPLTPRVTTSRLWQVCFGYGLVRTMADFGSQGEWPTHPELLEWLASRFVESGWDVKGMLRLIVTSSTYRQDSRIIPELQQRDPENRLLARGPRHRMPAEMIRDNALFMSGLLHEQLGGPSVHPYHPPGLWEEQAWADSPWKTWKQGHGQDLYRRGLYTFWKRSVLYPQFALFDAADRTVCAVSRPITNTPLQAFVTLNETTYVEAARVFAQRLMQEAPVDEPKKIEWGFELALSRPPSPAEQDRMRTLLRQMRANYQNQPTDAEQLLSVGERPRPDELDPVELAAWTCVTHVILNLDETMTKE